MSRCFPLIALVGAAFLTAGMAPLPPESDAARLQQKLKDQHFDPARSWIYNDLPAAIAEARRTNRPIFVTFRCVPCKACAGFDAEVAGESELIQKLAREKFVSLRQVEMKGVDLSQFQFDYDLNWAAMFINADGTVYARYGTQSEAGPDAYNSIRSLEKTMERVLELHAAYPGNRPGLVAKRGPDKPYRTALDMPGLEERDRLAGETFRNNCIHCHMILDAEQNQARKAGTFTKEMLKRWPLPDFVGLKIDHNDGRVIEAILPDSAAAGSSLKAADEITQLNGQAITSIADMQWVLNNLPDKPGVLKVSALRAGQAIAAEIHLPDAWKQFNWRWRGSRWSLRPRPGFWAPLLKPEELEKLSLPEGSRAYRVQWIVANQPEGKAAKQAGLREGDVILKIDGKPVSLTPEQFQMQVRMEYKVGQKLPVTVLRRGRQVDISLPLVE